MSRYLVTGGAGFIGSNIAEALTMQKHEVRLLDNFSTGRRENIAEFENQIELIEGTVSDLELCREVVDGVDFILHHAALCSVPMSVERPLESNQTNITGTLNLLLAARDAGVRRFIYAASSSAYGETAISPQVETMPAAPGSPYAIQKYTGELYCRIFHELYGLETVSLRYFNVFGPRQDPGSRYAAAIPKFITAALRAEAPIIFGDGEQTRDFTHVDNVTQANLAACTAGKQCAGRVLNIASGEGISVNALTRTIRNIVGGGRLPRHSEERAGDVKHSLADITAANKSIGFDPKVGFQEGLERTVTWYSARL